MKRCVCVFVWINTSGRGHRGTSTKAPHHITHPRRMDRSHDDPLLVLVHSSTSTCTRHRHHELWIFEAFLSSANRVQTRHYILGCERWICKRKRIRDSMSSCGAVAPVVQLWTVLSVDADDGDRCGDGATVNPAKPRVMAPLVECCLHSYTFSLVLFFFSSSSMGQYLVNIENVLYVGQSDVHEEIDGQGPSWVCVEHEVGRIGVPNTVPHRTTQTHTRRNNVVVAAFFILLENGRLAAGCTQIEIIFFSPGFSLREHVPVFIFDWRKLTTDGICLDCGRLVNGRLIRWPATASVHTRAQPQRNIV